MILLKKSDARICSEFIYTHYFLMASFKISVVIGNTGFLLL